MIRLQYLETAGCGLQTELFGRLIKADLLLYAYEKVDSTVVLTRSGYYSSVLENWYGSGSASGLERLRSILAFLNLQEAGWLQGAFSSCLTASS